MNQTQSCPASLACPALLISAPSSGQGKTTVTAALARFHRNQGRNVHVFKTGPDFLDPMILAQASGNPVYQLDLWMGGEDHCRELIYSAAKVADIILIEGVMGLFDGNSSSAELAKLFNIPVLAVINASAMAQTFGAIAYGLAHYDKELPFAGVLANRVGSENHKDMISESLPADIPFYGALYKNEDYSLPSRHLGLHQAQEIFDLEERLEESASALASEDWDLLPQPVNFSSVEPVQHTASLKGQRIAVAKDSAFSFVYQANLDLLTSLGAELSYFSPLHDDTLPDADSLYLPGGYPELYLNELAENTRIKHEILRHVAENKPIVAECGGMLYLLESLTDKNGAKAQMLGVISGTAEMQSKLANLGMHSVEMSVGDDGEKADVDKKDDAGKKGEIRGHTYHHSKMHTSITPVSTSIPQRKRGKPEPVFRINNIHASYMHLYFPSNPDAVVNLFTASN